jgi:16S rRNA (guanine527-N7)-methyltransferase
MTNKKTFLQQALFDNQLELSTETQDLLLAYLNLLEQWNRVHNLTAIRDPQEMVMLHLIDSLVVNRFLQGARMIDVGSGAGLPGIPLALVNPEKEFVLLDSNSKKTRFLNQVVLDLHLKNVKVEHARVENFHPEKCFDSVISRAFASLKDMLQATAHLVDVGGRFLAMKGVYPEDEIRQVSEDFRVMNVYALRINGMDVERHLVCIEKLNY